MRRTPARQRTFMEHQAIQYQTWEAAFLPTATPADAFREGVLRVEITNPFGDVRWREGFWDGGVWRLRWMPLEGGPHHLRFETNLQGLPESLGIVVEAAAWPRPGFRHHLSTSGPVRVSDEGVHFVRHDGTPFFLKTEEVHSVPTRATDAEWAAYCARRSEAGLNGASFATDLQRFFSPRPEREPRSLSSGFAPDLAYLARLDARIATLNAHGIVAIPDLFRLITIDDPTNPHDGADLDDLVSGEDAIRLGRYFVARWGAYDVLWRVGLPGASHESEETIRATVEIGRGVFGDDPWRAPVAVGLSERELLHPALRTEPWIGWVASRSHGHWIEASLRWIWTDYAADAASEFPRPQVNVDPVVYGEQWEVDDPQSARSARRSVVASLFAAPPAGVGYTMRAVQDWRRGTSGSDAAPSVEVGTTWIEALADPSAVEIGRLDETLSRFRWSELRPAPELLASGRTSGDPMTTIGVLANSDRSIVRVYVPGLIRFRLVALSGSYEAYWVPLRHDGAEAEGPRVPPGMEFEPPADEDWILHLDAI